MRKAVIISLNFENDQNVSYFSNLFNDKYSQLLHIDRLTTKFYAEYIYYPRKKGEKLSSLFSKIFYHCLL